MDDGIYEQTIETKGGINIGHVELIFNIKPTRPLEVVALLAGVWLDAVDYSAPLRDTWVYHQLVSMSRDVWGIFFQWGEGG